MYDISSILEHIPTITHVVRSLLSFVVVRQ